jgi:L-lactate dehydrogenase complex protein LldF
VIPTCHDFVRNCERALSNRNLQEAISRTTGRFLEHRHEAVRSFPGGFEAAREAASRLKLAVLRDLDIHLSRFIEEAERRGATVHIARDAAEARDIAARIAREEGVRVAVKSKSMATEEIGFNEALAEAGVEVVESDLGEYIIQLAGEPPSHLIAPAVHKTREEVSRLFAEKLGEPYTEEIPELVAIARRRLREKFLSADMGVSGANFLVAETGSIAIVSNEANARMATTLPRVHLAVASIEKVIPLMSDLPQMLRLLTRSATGQPISSYVSVLTGIRRPGDAEGPSKLHILLVDNGRSAILKGKYREILKCIRCGACLNICPVYQSIGGHAYGWVYPGPMGSVLSPLLLGLREASALPDASTLCGACADVCPVKIPLPDLLLELRADARAQGHRTPGEVLAMKGFAAVMGRAGILEAFERIAGVVSRLLCKDGNIPWLPFGLSGWTDRRDFPAPAVQPFRKLWKGLRGIAPWNR